MDKRCIKVALLLVLSVFLDFSLWGQQGDLIFPDYLTPEMYGAKGDGKQDDTDALRKALYDSSTKGRILYFPSGRVYLVTGPLNYYKGSYQDIRLNMLGCIPVRMGSYTPKEYGGITVVNGVHLFQDATISGSIERICITGKRDKSVHFFDNCDCQGIVIKGCNISNFGVLFNDSSLNKISQITQNTFLTLFYFARNDKSSCGMTDSIVSDNYINGGMELNDNSCFEWSYYNGSTISNNFIDYYRTVYAPKSQTKQVFVGPQSYSNQYQVFRYFYTADETFSSVTFTSTADSFNWNDPTTLEKLRLFAPETYKGKDGKIYEIPPYVAMCRATWSITISEAKIERNMGALVFVFSSLTEYEYNRFDVSFTGNNQYKPGQINYKQGDIAPFYNNGKYRQNAMKIKGIVETLDKLPNIGMGWTNTVQGRVIKVGEKLYRANNHFDGKTWAFSWDEIQLTE